MKKYSGVIVDCCIFGLFTVCVNLRIKHIRLRGAKLNCGVLVKSLYVFHAVQCKIYII